MGNGPLAFAQRRPGKRQSGDRQISRRMGRFGSPLGPASFVEDDGEFKRRMTTKSR